MLTTTLPDACNVAEEPALAEPVRYTPRWAFTPWISKDLSDGPDTYAFVDGFKSRDIPVGVVVIDSLPWAARSAARRGHLRHPVGERVDMMPPLAEPS